jgi:hypothetical protein
VIEPELKHWWKGSLNGEIGRFPLSYVEKLSATSLKDLEFRLKLETDVYNNLALLIRVCSEGSEEQTKSPYQRSISSDLNRKRDKQITPVCKLYIRLLLTLLT